MGQESASRHVAALFAAQRAAYLARPYPALTERRAKLRALKRQLQRYQDLLADALSDDFGHRARTDSKLLDLVPCVLHIDQLRHNLKRWARPSRRRPELLFSGNRLEVRYQPKGVVGVISAWNFPVYIALAGLATALAAGNRAMLKMSEYNPHTTAVLRSLLGEIFADEEVAVVGRELEDPGLFTSLPFDHIVFTGSPAVGRKVMAAAAENLTPVTLELGGKSPAILLPDYDLADAARRIVHGKSTNGGQICIAPDYALVPNDRLEAFIAAAQEQFRRLYGPQAGRSEDYTSILDERQFARLRGLLEDARAKGARIRVCGDWDGRRRMPLHIVSQVTPDMRILQEELFGPILPVIGYRDADDAVAHVNRGPRPLALYVFSRDGALTERILSRTVSGGVTVNDWGWHAVNHRAPFGGVGQSGMGNYHGLEGFRELSHARTVFIRRRWFPTQLFHPPYGSWVQKLSLRFYLGKGDPALQREDA